MRVPSLIAQLAGGLQTQAEKATGETKGKEFGGGFKWLLELAGKGAFGSTSQNKTVTDPHDYLLGDLLVRLTSLGYISSDPKNAPVGSVVRASGDLQFVDGSQLMSALGVLSGPMLQLLGANSPQLGAMMQTLPGLLASQTLPPMFVVRSKSGLICGGALKADGLNDPVSATLACHGNRPLRGIHVVGFKEESGDEITAPKEGDGESENTFNLASLTALGGAISKQLLPADAVRIAPILIYHFVEPIPKP